MAAGLEALAARVEERPRITVLTGAGVSVGSGVPSFRGRQGLWRGFRPEDLATPQAFARDPARVWEWYAWRRRMLAACAPNRAHEVLAAWSRRYAGFRLVTQNVDGLHEAAGTRNVLRFHGCIWDVRCWDACPEAPAAWRDARLDVGTLPPACPHCGGILRPAVVWFGEPIPPGVLEAASRAVHCELFLTVGTSAVVHPAAALIPEARRRGVFTVEINPAVTAATGEVDLALAGPAEEVLDRVEALLQSGSR